MAAPAATAARPPSPVVASPPADAGWAMVVDRKNLMMLWLEEKLARHEITPAEADKMLDEQNAQAKLWTGPMKDGRSYYKLLQQIADDFGAWHAAKAEFTKSKAGHDLVIFKGRAGLRKITKGTRYRVDNAKMVKMQIGKPGIYAAAKESARFGIYFVVAADILQFLFSGSETLGQLLGNLTVDIPSVVIASAAGAAAGSFISSTAIGMTIVGGLACGPFLVAFAAGVVAAAVLFKIDDYFQLHQKLGRAYDAGLTKLGEVWHELGADARARFDQLARSRIVHDMRQDASVLATKLAYEADRVRGELIYLW